MAARPLSPPNSQDPPELLLNRTAQVSAGGINTLRVPGDSFSDKTNAWFRRDSGMLPLRRGNEVKYLIDGQQAFREMVEAIRTATGLGHFIYMSNWYCDDSFNLPSHSPVVTLRRLLCEASDNNVMVRAMFWDQQFSLQNNAEGRHINDLTNGAAIIDAIGNEEFFFEQLIPFHFGSQHQKMLCVLGEQGLIAFCGGIDFNRDRIEALGSGSPLHDVHCRIRGPAALDLLHTFIQRWNDHPEGKKHNRPRGMGGKGPLITVNQLPPPAGPYTVQIGRTYGRGNYTFAPNGETTARELIRRAIRNAKRFIYTEDQYFVGNPEVQADLIYALRQNRIRHLTILLTHWRISDLPLVQSHRRAFIGALKRAGGDRVRVFALKPGGFSEKDFEEGRVPHTYVHAKTWIMDDEFAVIGSVNTNRRSWSHDSEVTAGIYDTSNARILTCRLTHRLR
ncbi:MAG: phosphatidylserine/phosphatidylglycerophosphate/cardiolipin synthase family protein, partial [Anaerolineae bacterium]